MKRRTLLAGVAVGAVGISGCLAGGTGDDGGNDSDGGDDGNTGPPAIVDSSIETAAQECGSPDAGQASAERGDGEVLVTGVIGASNPCHQAVLSDVAIHNRQLVVTVDLEATGEACRSCVGEIEYEATVTVEHVDGLYGTMVEHPDEEFVTNWEEPDDVSP